MLNVGQGLYMAYVCALTGNCVCALTGNKVGGVNKAAPDTLFTYHIFKFI